MSFSAQKILDSDISTYGVQSQPNKLTGSALENKKVFDKLIDAVVQERFNALIDELIAQTAAGQIGCSVTGLTSTDLAAALLEILTIANNATTGEIGPGGIEETMIATGAVTKTKLGGILPDDVGIKMGTTVPTTSDISAGQIYLKYST